MALCLSGNQHCIECAQLVQQSLVHRADWAPRASVSTSGPMAE
jgi:hypothetical protein